MKILIRAFTGILLTIFFTACDTSFNAIAEPEKDMVAAQKDSSVVIETNGTYAAYGAEKDTVVPLKNVSINTHHISPEAVVAYAQTWLGTPYKYASADPAAGFDCSGFITYVFSHFNIPVPRSSIDFTNAGTPVDITAARPGDLILFTGTDSTQRFVGHMGIITNNSDSVRFIHSSSGKAKGVTVTALSNYYKSRYVKTIRIFPQKN